MLPIEGYVTTDDGVRLFFQQLGSGRQTVIVANAIYLFDDFKRLASEDRTVIFYDPRNRGRSHPARDDSRPKRGIHDDVDDLEVVRRHFGADKVDLIGHSYLGMMVALYAMKYPTHARRVVQIGPAQPNASKRYPPHLVFADATLTDVSSQLAQLRFDIRTDDPQQFCRKWWSLARTLFVADPADAEKLKHWGFCDMPNELNFMKHWLENVAPSIQNLALTAADFEKAQAQVLTVHGTKDRQVPYGGGREWALLLPDARLLTVANAAHAPWVEAPQDVFGAIETFLAGSWPTEAHKVSVLDPTEESKPRSLG